MASILRVGESAMLKLEGIERHLSEMRSREQPVSSGNNTTRSGDGCSGAGERLYC